MEQKQTQYFDFDAGRLQAEYKIEVCQTIKDLMRFITLIIEIDGIDEKYCHTFCKFITLSKSNTLMNSSS